MRQFSLLKLLLISLGIKILSIFVRLPGSDIDTFIRLFVLGSIRKLGIEHAFQLCINPISSVRYFEFDFVRRQLDIGQTKKILDVSSPRAFAFWLCKNNSHIQYTMINPDPLDRKETLLQLSALSVRDMKVKNGNACKLAFRENTFDTVISISVIEHIEGKGDSQAMKEMWRVLRPGGKLILTTHVMKKYRDEYRNIDQYNLHTPKEKKRYFFQRIYDKKSLQKRVMDAIGIKPTIIELIGEKEKGWFDEYVKRWRERGLKETVWDPWYIMSKFQKYDAIGQLPGVGVIGLVFEKK